jgi:hypothetical protein
VKLAVQIGDVLKNPRGFVMSIYQRKRAKGGRLKMAGEAFAHVKIYQLLKNASRVLTSGRNVRLLHLPDGGKDGRLLTVLEAERTSSSSDSSEMQKAGYAHA